MLQFVPNWHPILVHFTIALLATAVLLFVVIAIWGRKRPLGGLDARAGELDASKPVIVCCASGTRSAMAAAVLARRGFKEVVNAGPWANTL